MFKHIPVEKVWTFKTFISCGMFVNYYSECFPEILQFLHQHKFLPIITLHIYLNIYFCQTCAISARYTCIQDFQTPKCKDNDQNSFY